VEKDKKNSFFRHSVKNSNFPHPPRGASVGEQQHPQTLSVEGGKIKIKKKNPNVLISHNDIVISSDPVVGRCAIYFLIKNKKVVYVGKSRNVIGRIGKHILDGLKDFNACAYIEITSEFKKDMGFLEYTYIKKFRPKYNNQYKDSKPNKWSQKYYDREKSDQKDKADE